MDRYQQTNRVAVSGMVSNVFLLIIKLIAGFMSGSQAMIADGFNSAGDVFASLMTYIGNKISGRPEDHNHPYGHGKAEYIFSMLISVSLLLVAYKILKSSLDSILHREYFVYSLALVAVAVVTILLKLCLFFYSRGIGRKQDNLLVLANAEDHRNDVFVTSSTLLGICFGRQGIRWIDGAVGIGISLWIAYTGIRIFKNAYLVLMDTDIDRVLKADIVAAAHAVRGVDHVDAVHAKPIGVAFIVIIKVSVRGGMSVQEGHAVAARVKERLKSFKGVRDVVVHINPA